MIQMMRTLVGVALTATIAACGGGGGSAGITPGVTPGLATPASVEIFASAPQMSSSTSSSVTFTVVVKDSANQAIPNQTVTFSASSGNLSGALPSPKTGANGEAITGVSLSVGADQSNRTIVVTASAKGASQSISIPVSGTTISLVGDSSVLVGSAGTFTARAQDQAGQPIRNATLTVTSALGNAISPNTVVTDSQGAATFSYSGAASGVDTLTLTGLGATAVTTVSVSGEDFRIEAPTSNATLGVGASQAISARITSNGVPVAGRTVNFSSTRGVVSGASATTDANGRASASVSSATAGPATIVAQSGSSQTSVNVTFAATVPASLVLQANPGALPPNTNGSRANQSTIQAVVRDSAGNPVSGVVVNFSAITDGSNGAISPASGTTNANGSVSVQFTPGALPTANNGVLIRATVQGTAVSGDAMLTVSGQALFISIGSGNVISNLNNTTYEKEFSVLVTDVNGAPVGSKVVNLSVQPNSYGKGTLTFNAVAGAWGYSAGVTFCANEDTNRNGVLDTGEDFNGNGRLTPGLPVVVSPSSITTGADGFGTFKLQFGENFVPWLTTTITARASVSGTESVQTQAYALEGVSSDFVSETNPPQGTSSPFGTSTSCSSAN